MKAALYTLKLLAKVDFTVAAEENAKWLSLILNADQPLEFSGHRSKGPGAYMSGWVMALRGHISTLFVRV